MPNRSEVIITAGGTKEPIDDVRYIGNFSSGRFGHALAQKYVHHGHHVTLLSPSSVPERFGRIDEVDYQHFTSADDLKEALLGFEAAKLILHSAAVSDYTPTKIEGKISSDQENLTVELVRTPKILSLLRSHFGNETVLVGFKLLSNVETDGLLEVAGKQIEKNETDYSIANRLEDISPDSDHRKVHLLGSDGNVNTFSGKSISVAQSLYHAIEWNKQ